MRTNEIKMKYLNTKKKKKKKIKRNDLKQVNINMIFTNTKNKIF